MKRRLVVAVVLAVWGAAGCASSGAAPRPFPGAPTGATAPRVTTPAGLAIETVNPVATGANVVVAALALRGTPYRNGGSDVSGFDCSGFVQYVFNQVGHALPRETHEQFEVGIAVNASEAHAGDLVFFETVRPGASHVGIVLDEERFVHAPSSNGVVRVERYTSRYWSTRLVGARRIQ